MNKNRAFRSIKNGSVLSLLFFSTMVLLFPVYWTVINSFKSRFEIFGFPPTLWPKEWRLSAYTNVLLKTDFLLWIKNTFLVSTFIIAGVLVISSLAGYALSRYKFVGKTVILNFILLCQMLPPSLIIVPLYVSFVNLGLYDTLTSIVLLEIAMVAPVATTIFRGFFDTIPVEVEEAAMIDGCNQFQSLRRIVLPLALPGLGAVILFTFFVVWQRFIFAVTLIQSSSKTLLPVGLQYFLGEYTIEWGMILAASTIASLISISVLLFGNRYIVQGLTGGALKS